MEPGSLPACLSKIPPAAGHARQAAPAGREAALCLPLDTMEIGGCAPRQAKVATAPRTAGALEADEGGVSHPFEVASAASDVVCAHQGTLAPAPPRVLPAVLDTPVLQLSPPVRGYDGSNLDRSVRPQDDFHQYAVGGYLKAHPIPADKATWGVDGELNQRIQDILHGILEALPADARVGSNEQKLRDFYRSAMDQRRIDEAGLLPLRPLLDGIDAVQDRQGLQDVVARLHAGGLAALFSFYATPDAGNPEMVIGEASQGGLTMPNRDYYLSSEPDMVRVRDAFTAHVERMFTLAGSSLTEARSAARTVLAVEARLAEGSLAPEQMRDPQALHNPSNRAALAALTPCFDWASYFHELGRGDVESINVATPAFFAALDTTLATTPVEELKTYLRWQVLHQMAPCLSQELEKESFHFTGTVLTGVSEQPPRWKTVVRDTDALLGDALGQKFVEKHFTPQAKARMLEMVDNIKAATREKIQQGWMTEETRKGALAKVDSLRAKIGYPDTWKDYSSLDIRDDVYASNVLRARAFEASKSLESIGKPKDPNHWEMTASTVNAYYMPPNNEIVFPAAILQPPYFDVHADDAANYGATGATIGHELTHAFDDEGSKFDASGQLRTWMAPADLEAFERRTEGVARQLGELSYEGQPVNGHLVQGESIADLGGLELAWAAFQKAQQGKPEPRTDDGFTPQQRFFLSYALSWATNIRPEKARMLLSNDPHPLPHFRVLAPLANLPAFHQAFSVQPGDPMMRPEATRNKLWEP